MGIYLSSRGLCALHTIERYRDLLNADITMRRIVIQHGSIDTKPILHQHYCGIVNMVAVSRPTLLCLGQV